MIEDLNFYALDQMLLVKPCPQTAVISVLDNDEAKQRPLFEGFHSSLILEFYDTEEPGRSRPTTLWPDEPTEAEHEEFCLCKHERAPSLSDAKKIVDFIAALHQSPERHKVVVHCKAGLSRSAAIAAWVSVVYWVPMSGCRSTEEANSRMLRLLDKAAGRY